MEKLEQVSEKPELKEEMEKDVTSTSAQVLTQAASWANWAVGAIGAKFYKSANKPLPTPTQNKQATIKSDSTEKILSPTKSENTVIHNENVKMEDLDLQDDTNDDGWADEDADWGSLEECKLIFNHFILVAF